MCGIAGEIRFDGGVVDPSVLISIRDSMTHRGPDGSGLWLSPDKKVGLAHRRLSIIDLSEKAAQPMGNEDGAIQVVFNGEIYNHAEIRKELELSGGHIWRTDHSDTEVIIHAYEKWGIDCVSRFRGMFAIALWDARQRVLWLIRDRIGIKPLYYTRANGSLLFASEIKALLAHPAVKREVNEEAFIDQLTFLVTVPPQTIFKGISKLANGCRLRIAVDGGMREERYWDVLDHVQPQHGCSEEEVTGRLMELLAESVKYRKVSDVPMGIFLSGGIDSSANMALFARDERATIKTFTIGFEEEHESYRSEAPYARAVAEKYNAEHYEKRLAPKDLLSFIPEMVRLQDEPIADPVCVPLYYVCKLARDNGVIVCHVGEGADELFMGYPMWGRMRLLEKAAGYIKPLFARTFIAGMARFAGMGKTPHYEYLRRLSKGQPCFWNGAGGMFYSQRQALLLPALREKYRDRDSFEAIRHIQTRFEAKAWQKTPLQWMTYMDLNLRLPELLLMRVDKMSMAVSLECRVPFLDHKLVEYVMSLPEEMKVKNGELKYILKKALRGVIPDEVIDRKKQGFGLPMKEWFDAEIGKTAQAGLKSFCRTTGYFNEAEIGRYFNEGKGFYLWPLINFVYWHREYIENAPNA